MNTAHKIALVTNNKQETYFMKACGIARLAWNWGLARWQEIYQSGAKPSGFSLKKEFNALKRTQFPFVYEAECRPVTKYACQQPFIQLGQAWQRFFKKQAARPRFKKKGKSRDSFYIGGDQLKVDGHYVHIPNLGRVKMRECIRFEGKILSATVSRSADRWFISFCIDTPEQPVACESQTCCGIDLGVNYLAVIATSSVKEGLAIEAPKPLKAHLRKLRGYSRALSKKQLGSKGWKKQKEKIARLHARISNIRKDYLHKLSSLLTDSFLAIGMEDLHVKGMLRNRKLARSIADLGFYEFRRQLTYKSERKGNQLHLADRFYASSKTCSHCGEKKEELSLSIRMYECEHCGYELDRDLNAARNLRNKVPGAYGELTPEEMTALLEKARLSLATSIVETGIQHQTAHFE